MRRPSRRPDDRLRGLMEALALAGLAVVAGFAIICLAWVLS